ncbi:MAG: hypothetical protein LC660_06900 [Desulfobacteraceae bacterium]|nr:hypothetical protein [Desulfobacteraceae bacterium]
MSTNQKYILLVDDEERLLNSMAQRISLLGFEAIKASSGIKALDIAKKTRIDYRRNRHRQGTGCQDHPLAGPPEKPAVSGL